MKGIKEINQIKTDTPIVLSREDMIEAYWTQHPRYIFMKSVPWECEFLELGAGDGGVSFWKDWRKPHRNDIRMYGVDFSIGKFADRYERFDALNINREKLNYKDNSVDVIFSSNFFEHLLNFKHVVSEIMRVLRVGGVVYLETPNHNSLVTKSMKDFNENGFLTSTMNFYDDMNNVQPFSSEELCALFYVKKDSFLSKKQQFEVVARGTICNDFLANQLVAYGFNNNDQELTTYGLWLLAEWSDYVILRKQNE